MYLWDSAHEGVDCISLFGAVGQPLIISVLLGGTRIDGGWLGDHFSRGSIDVYDAFFLGIFISDFVHWQV